MQPKIVIYYRPLCPWSREVISFIKQAGFAFEGRDLSADAESLREMIEKTGQESSPCVEIDGHMLADVGSKEVEEYMRGAGLIG